MLRRTVSVSEEELQDYYEINKDRYLQDEQRQARHILILSGDDEAAAEVTASDILARARAGESFESLARENSQDGGTAQQGGDLGVLTRTQLPGELGGAIFSMGEGEIDGPVQTDFGFHVVRLDRILERGPLPLDQVRGELTTELQDQQAERLFRELERKLSDALFDATDIRTLAAEIDAEVKTMSGFTRSGTEPFGANQAVTDAVFDESVVKGGLLSPIVEIDANRSAVFSVTQHTEATREPLEDVRDAILEASAIRAGGIASGREGQSRCWPRSRPAKNLRRRPKLSARLSKCATVMSRDAQDMDQSVAVAVFTAVKPEEGQPTTGSTRNDDGGFTVFSVDAVIPGRPEAIPLADRDAGKLQLADQSGIGDFVAFVQALRADADVDINEDALAAQDLFQ